MLRRRNYRSRRYIMMPIALILAAIMLLSGPASQIVMAGIEAGTTPAPVAASEVNPQLNPELGVGSDTNVEGPLAAPPPAPPSVATPTNADYRADKRMADSKVLFVTTKTEYDPASAEVPADSNGNYAFDVTYAVNKVITLTYTEAEVKQQLGEDLEPLNITGLTRNDDPSNGLVPTGAEFTFGFTLSLGAHDVYSDLQVKLPITSDILVPMVPGTTTNEVDFPVGAGVTVTLEKELDGSEYILWTFKGTDIDTQLFGIKDLSGKLSFKPGVTPDQTKFELKPVFSATGKAVGSDPAPSYEAKTDVLTVTATAVADWVVLKERTSTVGEISKATDLTATYKITVKDNEFKTHGDSGAFGRYYLQSLNLSDILNISDNKHATTALEGNRWTVTSPTAGITLTKGADDTSYTVDVDKSVFKNWDKNGIEFIVTVTFKEAAFTGEYKPSGKPDLSTVKNTVNLDATTVAGAIKKSADADVKIGFNGPTPDSGTITVNKKIGSEASNKDYTAWLDDKVTDLGQDRKYHAGTFTFSLNVWNGSSWQKAEDINGNPVAPLEITPDGIVNSIKFENLPLDKKYQVVEAVLPGNGGLHGLVPVVDKREVELTKNVQTGSADIINVPTNASLKVIKQGQKITEDKFVTLTGTPTGGDNITFTLYSDSACKNEVASARLTDKGYVIFTGLAKGVTYYLKESDPSKLVWSTLSVEGLTYDDRIVADGYIAVKIASDVNAKNVETVKNPTNYGSFTITKYLVDNGVIGNKPETSGNILFSIYAAKDVDTSGSVPVLKPNANPLKDGDVKVNGQIYGLEAGTYYAVEKATKDGTYYLDATPIKFEVAKNSKTEVGKDKSILNYSLKSQIEITKKWSGTAPTGSLANKVTFTVYTDAQCTTPASGGVVKIGSTGKAIFPITFTADEVKNNTPKTFWIKETAMASDITGHEMSDKVEKVTVYPYTGSGTYGATVEFINPEKKKLIIEKYDTNTPPQLIKMDKNHATFELTYNGKNGKTETITIGKDGTFSKWLDSDVTSVTIEEKTAPNGYQVSKVVSEYKTTITYTNTDKVKTAKFYNAPTNGSFAFKKVDSVTNAALSGGSFKLVEIDGNGAPVANGAEIALTAGSGGVHSTKELVTGKTYKLVEVTAPTNYLMGSDVTITVASDAKGVITVTKTDGTGAITSTFYYQNYATANILTLPNTKMMTLKVNKFGNTGHLEGADKYDLKLAGAKFEVYDSTGNQLYFTGSNGVYTLTDTDTGVELITNAAGQITISGLDPTQKYTVKEIEPPAGYVAAEDPYEQVVPADKSGIADNKIYDSATNTYFMSFNNDREFGRIQVHKEGYEDNVTQNNIQDPGEDSIEGHKLNGRFAIIYNDGEATTKTAMLKLAEEAYKTYGRGQSGGSQANIDTMLKGLKDAGLLITADLYTGTYDTGSTWRTDAMSHLFQLGEEGKYYVVEIQPPVDYTTPNFEGSDQTYLNWQEVTFDGTKDTELVTFHDPADDGPGNGTRRLIQFAILKKLLVDGTAQAVPMNEAVFSVDHVMVPRDGVVTGATITDIKAIFKDNAKKDSANAVNVKNYPEITSGTGVDNNGVSVPGMAITNAIKVDSSNASYLLDENGKVLAGPNDSRDSIAGVRYMVVDVLVKELRINNQGEKKYVFAEPQILTYVIDLEDSTVESVILDDLTNPYVFINKIGETTLTFIKKNGAGGTMEAGTVIKLQVWENNAWKDYTYGNGAVEIVMDAVNGTKPDGKFVISCDAGKVVVGPVASGKYQFVEVKPAPNFNVPQIVETGGKDVGKSGNVNFELTNYPYAKITVMKTDYAYSSAGLKDFKGIVEFTLTEKAGLITEQTKTIDNSTNVGATTSVDFTNLPKGTYTLTETKFEDADGKYFRNPSLPQITYIIEINEKGEVTAVKDTNGNQVNKYRVGNTVYLPNPEKVLPVFEKQITFINGDGEVVTQPMTSSFGGATFQLFRVGTPDVKIGNDIPVGADGKIILPALDTPGTYYIIETAADNGIIKPTGDNKIVFTVGYKIGAPGYEGVLELKIPQASGKQVQPVNYDGKGAIIIQKKLINENGVEIQNPDASGIAFELYKSVGGQKVGAAVKSGTTNAAGKLVFNELEAGDYILVEVDATTGITVNGGTFYGEGEYAITVTVADKDNAPKPIEYEVKNYAPVDLVIWKQDTNGHDANGATFELQKYDAAKGQYVKEQALLVPQHDPNYDMHSVVAFENLSPGTYKVVETEAPNGYDKNDLYSGEFEIKFDTNGKLVIEMINSNKATQTDIKGAIAFIVENTHTGYRVEVSKVDENKKPLIGAEFTLYHGSDANGTKLGTFETDAKGYGYIDVSQKPPYFLVETKAPAGYMLHPDLGGGKGIEIKASDFTGSVVTKPIEVINYKMVDIDPEILKTTGNATVESLFTGDREINYTISNFTDNYKEWVRKEFIISDEDVEFYDNIAATGTPITTPKVNYTFKTLTIGAATVADGKEVWANILTTDGSHELSEPISLATEQTIDWNQDSFVVQYGHKDGDGKFVHEIGKGFTALPINVKMIVSQVAQGEEAKEILGIRNTAEVIFYVDVYKNDGTIDEDQGLQKRADSSTINSAVDKVDETKAKLDITKGYTFKDPETVGGKRLYTYTLTTTLTEAPMTSPVIIDTLPDGVDLVGKPRVTLENGSALALIEGEVNKHPGYLVFMFKNTMSKDEVISIEFDVTVQESVLKDTKIKNHAYASSWAPAIQHEGNTEGLYFESGNPSKTLEEHEEFRGIIDWTAVHNNKYVYADAEFTAISSGQLSISKKVSGDLSIDAQGNNYYFGAYDKANIDGTVAKASVGGKVYYKILVTNHTDATIDNIRVADLLPQKNDHKVTGANNKRETEWSKNSPFENLLSADAILIDSDEVTRTNLAMDLYGKGSMGTWSGAEFSGWMSLSGDGSDSVPAILGMEFRKLGGSPLSLRAKEKIEITLVFSVKTVEQNFDPANYEKLGINSAAVAKGQGQTTESENVAVIIVPELASLGDYVWYDVNDNGLQDSDEPGVKDVTVTLYHNQYDPNTDTWTESIGGVKTTDGDGYYLFDKLTPGLNQKYRVEFTRPDGYGFAKYNSDGQGLEGEENSDADYTADPLGRLAVTASTEARSLQSGEAALYFDCGLVKLYALGDTVWLDENFNGLQDGGEIGVDGVKVTLYKVDMLVRATATEIASTVTDVDANGNHGKYLFENLVPTDGTFKYQVKFDLGDVGDTIALDDGTYATRYYFTKHDGDYGEEFNSDAIVDLTTAAGRLATSALTQLIDIIDQDVLTIDAGLVITAAVGDTTWEDTNLNGIQDKGEPMLDGVDVTIYRKASEIDSAVKLIGEFDAAAITAGSDSYVKVFTDYEGNALSVQSQNGKYMIERLVPGSYLIQFGDEAIDPATGQKVKFAYTKQHQGGAPALDSDGDSVTGITDPFSFTMVNAVVDGGAAFKDRDLLYDITIDQGYFRKGGLGDYVWADLNRDGLQDASEPGINDVTVKLFMLKDGGNADVLSDYTQINEMTTITHNGKDGHYYFGNLDAGTYRVQFGTSPLYPVYTVKHAGNDRTIDSNVNIGGSWHGFSDAIDLGYGEIDLTIDAGLCRSGGGWEPTPTPSTTTTPPTGTTTTPTVTPNLVTLLTETPPMASLPPTRVYLVPDDEIPYGYIPKPANRYVDIEEDPIPYGPTTKTGQITLEVLRYVAAGTMLIVAGLMLFRRNRYMKGEQK